MRKVIMVKKGYYKKLFFFLELRIVDTTCSVRSERERLVGPVETDVRNLDACLIKMIGVNGLYGFCDTTRVYIGNS